MTATLPATLRACAFDLSGRLALVLEGADDHATASVSHHLDPFAAQPVSGTGADVTLRACAAPHARLLADVQNPARDGVVTAWDGEQLWVLAGGRACSVPHPLGDAEITFEYEPGFPLGTLFRALVRPTLQLQLLRGSAAALHAAVVEIDGQAVVVAGWSESGKTETALALMEQGASFLSDKWAVAGGDGMVSAFPVNVGIRGWVLPYLPRLASSLPGTARTQLRAAHAAARLSQPLRRNGAAGNAARMAERAVNLADRAALTPTQLRAAYGQHDDPARRVPLGTVALLTTTTDGPVTAAPMDPARAAQRLVRSAAYERRDYFALLERRRYASTAAAPLLHAQDDFVPWEEQILLSLLAEHRVLDVRAPFPTDPRPVAEAIARWL